MIQHLDHTAWKYSFKDFDPDWQDPETEYEYEVDTNNGENTVRRSYHLKLYLTQSSGGCRLGHCTIHKEKRSQASPGDAY